MIKRHPVDGGEMVKALGDEELASRSSAITTSGSTAPAIPTDSSASRYRSGEDHLGRRHLRRDHLSPSLPPGPRAQEGARHPQVRGRHAARPCRREGVLRDLLRASPVGTVGFTHEPALPDLLVGRRWRRERGLRRPGRRGRCRGRCGGHCRRAAHRRADQTRAPRRARDRGRLLLARPATNHLRICRLDASGGPPRLDSQARLLGEAAERAAGAQVGSTGNTTSTTQQTGTPAVSQTGSPGAGTSAAAANDDAAASNETAQTASDPTSGATNTSAGANGETTTTGTPAPPKESVNSKEIKKAKEEEAKKVKEEERKAREEAKRLKEAEAKKAKEEELRVEEEQKKLKEEEAKKAKEEKAAKEAKSSEEKKAKEGKGVIKEVVEKVL